LDKRDLTLQIEVFDGSKILGILNCYEIHAWFDYYRFKGPIELDNEGGFIDIEVTLAAHKSFHEDSSLRRTLIDQQHVKMEGISIQHLLII